MRLVRVAVPVPALDSLTYSLPDAVPDPPVGARVLVPLGNRVLTGCRCSAGCQGARVPSATGAERAKRAEGTLHVKPILEILDTEPFLPRRRRSARHLGRGVLRLRDRRGAGHGDAAAGSSRERNPGAARRSGRSGSPQLTAQGPSTSPARDADAAGSRPRRAAASRRSLRSPERLTDSRPSQPRRARGIAAARLGAAVDARARVVHDRNAADRARSSAARWRRSNAERRVRLDALTTEQDGRAVDAASGWPLAASFHAALLHGVTGSGKTEVYLRLAGRRPSTRARRARAGAGNRADAGGRRRRSGARSANAWRSSTAACPTASATTNGIASAAATSTSSSARGRPCSRRSTRSASIIVDEEHDGSYKQEESPRYHGRDVAVMRARQAGALVGARIGDAVDGELPERAERALRRS